MTAPNDSATAEALTRKPLDAEIDVHGLTHQGRVRKSNQDHFLIASVHKRTVVHGTSVPELGMLHAGEERLAVLGMVADGVGGGEGGEEASRLTVEQVMRYVTSSMRCYYSADASTEAFVDALQEAAMQCHASLVERQRRDRQTTLATTLTLWLGVWPWYYLLQVGDSRYYRYADGELTQISRDQTVAQELFDAGVFTRTDAANSDWANVLASAIGGTEAMPVVTRLKSEWRYTHLLCSDGLTKHVSDERIRERLATMTSAQQACEALVQDALDDGGTDNVTVIVGRAVPVTTSAAP